MFVHFRLIESSYQSAVGVLGSFFRRRTQNFKQKFKWYRSVYKYIYTYNTGEQKWLGLLLLFIIVIIVRFSVIKSTFLYTFKLLSNDAQWMRIKQPSKQPTVQTTNINCYVRAFDTFYTRLMCCYFNVVHGNRIVYPSEVGRPILDSEIFWTFFFFNFILWYNYYLCRYWDWAGGDCCTYIYIYSISTQIKYLIKKLSVRQKYTVAYTR